ncbi:hypothetical protein [Absidia glauca]|uniref:HCP-like protein n=1 Tax=Absidia glauca TaxID=4829 RepID=A0A163JRH4_ABSGL|nr:hypothetical protein [Absidia glauca]
MMGAQQSKPKRRQPITKSAQTTTRPSSPHAVANQPAIMTPPFSSPNSNTAQQRRTPTTTATATTSTTTTTSTATALPPTKALSPTLNHSSMDEKQQSDIWMNRLVEPDSMNLHVYLDQRTVTDLFVDGDTDDMPDFDDVDSSTISSQHSALFSTLSSVASSSVSSISSSLYTDKPPAVLRQPSSDSRQRQPLSAVFDRSPPSLQLASFDDLVRLAEQSDRVELSYCVAVCYYRGWLNKVDHIKALYWFKRAALQPDDDKQHSLVALSQYRIGKMLLSQNKDIAWTYLDLAANNGNSRAEYLMGWKAEKLEKDPQKALGLYLSSCRHGLVEAQTALGCLLINHATYAADTTINLDGLSIPGSRDQQALCLLEGAADKVN